MAQIELIEQQNLKQYLHSIQTFALAEIIRKGRDIKSNYVEVEKSENGFLGDIFKLKDGVTIPKKKTWVARETLFCNGKGNCLRGCGAYGKCNEDCPKRDEKRAKSGHRCQFRVNLHMYADNVGKWVVEVTGSHVPPTVIWNAPTKNPLKEPETRKRALELLGSNVETKKIRGMLTDKPKRQQLDSFIQYHKKKEGKEPKTTLIEYSDSDSDIEVDNLLGINTNGSQTPSPGFSACSSFRINVNSTM